ncbi:MAG: 23S rRNA (uracil(1939)-C(5))-methyltransferase RlmD [Oscillospiraceae bacterium]|jgi:23S rRNA (uracil1939-C5)-methyltransferase|nr:23S rRNA (uracil(1939)-C(5))-methyltransferase RlmD [Oscillospiraceae bacterium]
MKKNDRLVLEVTGMTLQGAGIARSGGVPVFLPGTCPGDTVEALILKEKGNCAFGKCMEVLRPSAQRVEPECPVFPRCGGCAFRHISYAAELVLKERELGETLRRIGGAQPVMAPIVAAESPERYRNKAMLPLRREGDRVLAGFFARHSHRLVHSGDCLLEPEVFGRLAEAVCDWARQACCTVYDEESGTGLLRHIYLRKNRAGSEIFVCLVINGQDVPCADRLISRLRGVSTAVKAILLNHNSARTNVILGRACTQLWGARQITETLCGLEFSLSPLSFFQVNPAQAERLYQIAARYAGLRGRERVLDLYCGAGTVGLSMAAQAGEVIGVESVPQAVEDARRNAGQNGIGNARFLLADAAQAVWELEAQGWRPDVVLLDPPRKGCTQALLRGVAALAPARIVYLSCDPATLARDLAVLRDLAYLPEELTPVDMFPRTGHVESAVKLERAQG